MKPVFLIPGFSASDLFLQTGGLRVWFDTKIAAILNVGALRLAPNGIDPGPPDGQQCGIVLSNPQPPWGTIAFLLRSQLGEDAWTVQPFSYDWRLDLTTVATALADDIRNTVSSAEPATLVCHSAGGLVGIMVYWLLNGTGDADKVRRLITIGTPFQGSYGIMQWLTGDNPTVAQIMNYGVGLQALTGVNPIQFGLHFLSNLALTWPAFYELWPALWGSAFEDDPNRIVLYQAHNFPPGTQPSQTWLDYARNPWQQTISQAVNVPPNWVLTTVSGTGLRTPWALLTTRTPVELGQLGYTVAGDGLVTVDSSQLEQAKQYFVGGEHASLPFGLTTSGLLALLITDPRGPITPPAPPTIVKLPVTINVTAPPESEYLSGLTCLSGG